MTSGSTRIGSRQLHHCATRLAQVLTVPDTDPGWRTGLDDAVKVLRAVFDEHRRATERPGGHYPELVDSAPRLDRAVRHLVREHDAVSAELAALADHCARDDAAALRGQALRVLESLEGHRQRGADLVHEAFSLDLGGET